jgi:hypothetical protein
MVNVSGFWMGMLYIPAPLLPVWGHGIVHRRLSCLRLLRLGLLIIVSGGTVWSGDYGRYGFEVHIKPRREDW